MNADGKGMDSVWEEGREPTTLHVGVRERLTEKVIDWLLCF